MSRKNCHACLQKHCPSSTSTDSQGNFPIPKTAHLSKEDKKHFWGKITASVNIGSVNPIVPNAPFL